MNCRSLRLFGSVILLIGCLFNAVLSATGSADIHVWEMQEIVLKAEKVYDNYYTDVCCWIELRGPDFSRRIYGFWDGANIFRVRFVATKPGEWHWHSGSNQPDDRGFNDIAGQFTAVEWTEAEKQENPNRRGFVCPTPNGHALQYADGKPFFMVGDTWLAGSTWRLPFRNATPPEKYEPAPGIGFEDAVQYRKKQGFNSVSMISCFPNWDSDGKPSTYADSNGIFVRNAWEKFGYDVSDAVNLDELGELSYWGTLTAKDMRDESGNLPFAMSRDHRGVSDFNRINPKYFQSLDQKMDYLSGEGFVPLLETVRRDVGPSWSAYFDFNETFARFVQYLISRYGAYNMIFSGIHLDWIPRDFSLTAEEFNEALTYHLHKYGPLPFGQPVSTLISSSTYSVFGHHEDCPWLTMHSVGNKPRDHRVADSLEIIFRLEPSFPVINFEPYYTGWDHEINMPNGERPPANSERDNYFARAQMYGSVLSGALSGHVHGTSAYDITTTGEPPGKRHHIWEALTFESANYMQHLHSFVVSAGEKFQDLQPARDDVHPNKAPGSPPTGLDGWAYMLRTADQELAMLYFENDSVLPVLSGLKPKAVYTFKWFDPRTGEWKPAERVKTDRKGNLHIPLFPDGQNPSATDWAAIISKQ